MTSYQMLYLADSTIDRRLHAAPNWPVLACPSKALIPTGSVLKERIPHSHFTLLNP